VPELQTVERFIDTRLPDKIREVLHKEFADQKTVEIETAELVAERAIKWARTFGFFVGIPIALVSLILGFIGFKTWSDIADAEQKIAAASTGLAAAQTQLQTAAHQTADAEKRTTELLASADDFKKQLDDARTKLAAIPELQDRTRQLESDVQSIRNFVNKGGTPIPQDRRAGSTACSTATRRTWRAWG